MITRYEHYPDGKGEWRWTAYASNGEEIAVSSESYKELRDCLHAIDLMRASASATVVAREPVLVSLARAMAAGRSDQSDAATAIPSLALYLRHHGASADTVIGALSRALRAP